MFADSPGADADAEATVTPSGSTSSTEATIGFPAAYTKTLIIWPASIGVVNVSRSSGESTRFRLRVNASKPAGAASVIAVIGVIAGSSTKNGTPNEPLAVPLPDGTVVSGLTSPSSGVSFLIAKIPYLNRQAASKVTKHSDGNPCINLVSHASSCDNDPAAGLWFNRRIGYRRNYSFYTRGRFVCIQLGHYPPFGCATPMPFHTPLRSIDSTCVGEIRARKA